MGKNRKNGKYCLVLNKNGLAIDVSPVSHVIKKVQGERAAILDPVTWTRYTIEEWVARGASLDTCINAGSHSFDPPEIAICNFYDGTHPVLINLNKSNVLKRDGYRCVYCGARASTVDHIVPQCEKGPDSWKNMVACCGSCNNRKDRMPVKEFCEQMGCDVPDPWNPNAAPWLFKAGQMHIPDCWKQFIR